MADGYGAGALTYGIARGVQDAKREKREEEAFQGDQAIRRERLSQEQALGPQRARLLGAEADRSEALARAAPEQLDQQAEQREQEADKRDREAQEAERAQTEAAQKRELGIALGGVHGGGDPMAVAAWMDKYRPNPEGLKHGARRDENGNIQLFMTGPDGEEKLGPTFEHNKVISGAPRTADVQLGMFMRHVLDPLGEAGNEDKTDAKIRAEGEKQAEITNRAIIRRLTDAEKGKAAADARHERLAKSYLDSALKTTQIPGSFAATFSNEDDAKLMPVYYKKMSENLDAGKSPADAAQGAIEDIRVRYNTAKKSVMAAAKKLSEAGVDPRDAGSLRKAQAAGNANVEEYVKALGALATEFGQDIGEYTKGLTPRPRR